MKRMHFIYPSMIYKHSNRFFVPRLGITEKISEHFTLIIYAQVKQKNMGMPLPESVEIHNIFTSASVFHVLCNYASYKKKLIKNIFKDDLVLLFYPFKIKSIYYGLLLRKKRLVIWVKSYPPDQFIANGSLFTKPIRFLTYPLFKLAYDSISKFIFKNNLVFYTSNITTDKKNHLNQHEIISCAEFNGDKQLVKNTLTNKIFFVGGEENRKGLKLLLKALQHSNKELNIIGLDKLQRKQHQKLAPNVNIVFHGKIYNRELFFKKLSQADIVVMPSFGEKQGKVQLEAMSVGAVPICADSGGTYRTIDNYYNGLLFKEGNWKELQKQINLLYEEKELYKDLKYNGLEYIKTLSVEKQVEKMAKIIKNYYKK